MHEGLYYTYIIASRSHILYIGFTGNIHKRILEHKHKIHDGFASTYNCNRLVWLEPYADPSSAIAREKQLKGWTRAKKITLIERSNPTWADLSENWYKVPLNSNPGPS